MRGHSLISLLLIVVCAACVDRIIIDTGALSTFPVVIDGFISDQPGPYTIQLTKAYDIESKQSIKTPIFAKQLIISDDKGTTEVMKEIGAGLYATSATGIQGKVGNAYKIHIELLDGRIYESLPDTMKAAGTLDKVYFSFKAEKDQKGVDQYGFDVFFNSTAGEKNDYHFLWKFVGTFQADTKPELHDETCGQGRCPRPPACSGYTTSLEKIGPCLCCSCWYNFFNTELIVSDGQLVDAGAFKGIKAKYVPITQWTFMYKVHAQVNQMSLSRQSFEFWKGLKAQKNATSSLFQPVTGKIASNFVQISGPTAPIEGLFYATAISSNSVFITREDVPLKGIIPDVELPFTDDCKNLFPNATTTKPAYWGN